MSVSGGLLELSTKALRHKGALVGMSKRIQMRVLEMEIMIFNDDNEVASSTMQAAQITLFSEVLFLTVWGSYFGHVMFGRPY